MSNPSGNGKNDNGEQNFGPTSHHKASPLYMAGSPGLRRAHPENTCFGCAAVGLGVLLAIALSSYFFWRMNPEFHQETAGPGTGARATPAPRATPAQR